MQSKEGIRSLDDEDTFARPGTHMEQCEHLCTDSSNVIHFLLGGIISIMEHDAAKRKKLPNAVRL